MKNEAEFKAAFKKSVRSYKGASLSLAAPMLVGIPDLYVIMPGYAPVLLEAKWLGSLGNKFKRKIQFTAMQKHYLLEINNIKNGLALGLIGFKHSGKTYAVLVNPITEHLTNITWTAYPNSEYLGRFDVPSLFEKTVPRLNGYKIEPQEGNVVKLVVDSSA